MSKEHLDTPKNVFCKITRVKFCGITNIDDALFAESLGVSALGFVFVKNSPRHVSVTTAKQIIKNLGPFISTVGLFVNEDIATMNSIANDLNLSCVQLHGDESPALCEQIHKPYIKAIRVQNAKTIIEAETVYASANALLLDSFSENAYGGTGKQFDWDWIPNSVSKPLILAGGLNAQNVKQAIETVHPYAVDVSSGIEERKGKKSIEKMQSFMNEVNDVKES